MRGKTHFVGIGGVGMSGIAQLLLELGFAVSGSDLQVSESTQHLVDLGAVVYQGHQADNLAEDVQTVVVSSAIPWDNPEVVQAKKLGIPIWPRAAMLARLMERQKGIAIAGAHGKTTTTAMLAQLFVANKEDPSVVLGGLFKGINGNARLGQGKYFIAEADESDGSFLQLNPFITVVTNIGDDHLDFYGTKAKIEAAFLEFIEQTAPEGFALLCLDDPGVRRLLPQIKKEIKVLTYGFAPAADYRVSALKQVGLQMKFTVENEGEVVLNIPGKHNVYNALAAIAVARECGLSFAEIRESLASFAGVQRRFEKVAEVGKVTIFDDFAHHPVELQAVLATAQKVGAQRLLVVFQPHRFSRTLSLKEEFGAAFHAADLLVLTEIFAAGEKPRPGVTAHLLLQEIEQYGQPEVKFVADKNEIAAQLVEIVRPGDLVLTLGAGDIRAVGLALGDLLRRKA